MANEHKQYAPVKFKKPELSIDQTVLDAVNNADKELLIEIVRPLGKNRIKNDWLNRALELDRFDCFKILLEKKETVRLDGFSLYTVYGKALKKQDTRYLAMLMDQGGYESVKNNLATEKPLVGILLRKATAKSLRFLNENGYTIGLREGIEVILSTQTVLKGAQLSALSDQIFL